MFPFTRRASNFSRRILQSDPDCSRNLDEFWERLSQTRAWCSQHVDRAAPGVCLRPESFRPRILEPNYFATVRSVGIARAHEVSLAPVQRTVGDGRLLLYFPDAELADGAAEAESCGFFDVNNAPPHATWVGIFQDRSASDDSYATYLLAWVPPAFIELADRGIAVNPEECIAWLSFRDVGLRAILPDA
jgi:hypothetical protein